MEVKVKNWFTACTLLTGLCLGCSDASSTDKVAGTSGKTGAPQGPSAVAPPPVPKPFVPDEKPAQDKKEEPKTAGKEAKPGVGIQGQGYGDSAITGPITAPIRARFVAEQSINFSLMTHTLELYKAMHDGKGPQSHDEFMKVIIADGAIKLPQLPPGQRYEYDVKTEKLMVVEGS